MPTYRTPAEVTVGVIGYGGAFNMGKNHLEQMRAAGMMPKAVVELDPKRLDVARADFPGIETYPTADAMLAASQVQLVVIITPHNSHAELALKCLNAGKHVVCEKPLAITTSECDAMIAAAKANGLTLSTYHNRHWDGSILHAKDIIAGGAIGEIVRIEARGGQWGKPGDWWRSSRSISGGILYDWGVHLLEYSFQLITAPITEVSGFAKNGFWAAQTAWKNDTIEDEGFVVVRFASGQWLTLVQTSIDSNPKRGMVEVTGTKGSYLWEYGTWEQIVHHGDGSSTITKGRNPPDEYQHYYRNIADHLVLGTPLIITPEWSRRPIHVIDLAVQSAIAGKSLPATYA